MRQELDLAEASGSLNKAMVTNYRKHKNYCNRLQNKIIHEQRGENITPNSSMNQIWKVLRIILKPEKVANNHLRMIIDGESTEDPQKIAEAFVNFFKKKGDDLAAAIKADPDFDPLEQLKKKYEYM